MLTFNGTEWVNNKSPTFASFTVDSNIIYGFATGMFNNGTLPTLGHLDDYYFPLVGGIITGSTTISNTLSVSGDTSVGGTLDVSDDTTLQDTTVENLIVGEDLTVNATLTIPNLITGTATRSGYLYVDDNGEINKTPNLNIETSTSKSIIWTGQNGYGSTNQMIQNFSAEVKNDATELVTAVYTDGTNGASITALKRVVTSCSYSGATSSGNQFIGCSLNSSQLSTDIRSITAADRISVGLSTGDENGVPCDVILEIGDVLRPHTNRNAQLDTSTMVCTFTGLSEGVVHSGNIGTQIFELNQAGSTLLTNSGTFRFDLTAGGITQTATDTIMQVVDESSITKFKVLKDNTLTFFNKTPIANQAYAMTLRRYNSSDVLQESFTGSFTPTAGYYGHLSVVTRAKAGDYYTLWTASNSTNDPISVSFSAVLSARTIITPATQTCYVKDVKTSGTDGGSSTSDAITVRVLNTLENDCDFVSLSGGSTGTGGTANIFSLTPGKYELDINTPIRYADRRGVFLYNYDTSTYVGFGQSDFNGNSMNSPMRLLKTIDISETTRYQVINYTQSGVATDGLGINSTASANNPQTVEIYSIVKIKKLRWGK